MDWGQAIEITRLQFWCLVVLSAFGIALILHWVTELIAELIFRCRRRG